MAAKDAKKAIDGSKKAVEKKVTPRTVAGGPVWKVLNIGSTLIATKLATDAAQRTWKIATGRSVPIKGDYEHERTRDVIIFTALSSVLVSTARIAIERSVATYYRNSAGHLPKELEDEQASATDIKIHRKITRVKARNEYRVQKVMNLSAPRK
jgi:Protein of unknown function (DUF4235)